MMDFDDYLLVNGKKLFWKTKNARKLHINKYIWEHAISGLKADNLHIKKLIADGRKDIKENTDYTHPQHQNLSQAGPIKSGIYYLNLTKTMSFEKTGGGWGIGGWSIYPTNAAIRRLGFAEARFDIDIPWVRSGFFLHEDGGNDGTAGCIGLSKHGILNLKHYLIKYKAGTEAKRIHIEVNYHAS